MKKTLFAIGILLVSCLPAATAQWFIKLGLGYTIPNAAQTMDVTGNAFSGNTTYSPITDSVTSYSIKKASFSSGFKGIIGGGYHINSHFSVEVVANLGLSNTLYTSKIDNVITPNGAYRANNTITQQAKFPIMIMPAATFKTDKPKFNWYGRMGFVLPVKNEVEIDLKSDYIAFIPNVEEIKGTLKTRFNIGFLGAGGVSYTASKGVNVWAEFNYMSISLFAKETKITQHTGATNPNAAPLEGTTITYGFSGQAGSLNQPTFSIPYSNMGISIGATFDIK